MRHGGKSPDSGISLVRGIRLQNGAVLALASAAIGLLTTMSGVVIELASNMLADFRHGICVQRVPGDTHPLWQATFGGGFRPYDRRTCCGGAESVDYATEECRAQSIIQHSTRKHLALPLRSVTVFGKSVHGKSTKAAVLAVRVPGRGYRVGNASRSLLQEQGHEWRTSADDHSIAGAARERGAGATFDAKAKDRAEKRADRVSKLVDEEAARVRVHMSHVFGPDPGEEEVAEVAVNEGIVQTRTDSAGSLDPIYEWVPWERALPVRGPLVALPIYVIGTGFFAMLAALVTWCRPAARGSGITEVKATVAGFSLPSSFRAQTLLAKVVALSLCVGAGLAVGKEGPMIHIGACWGAILAVPIARIGKRYSDAMVEETELVCVGAAAGIAAAFGAPLAGVLFAVEELGTSLPTGFRYSTMLCAFGAAVTAALTLKYLDLQRNGRLTLFAVDYSQAWAPWEALPFCLLGALGGAFGGLFVLANESVARRRMRAESEGRAYWYLPSALLCSGRATTGARAVASPFTMPAIDGRILEMVLLAVFTGLTNYPHMLTRMLQNDAIKELFSRCPAATAGHHQPSRDPLGLCGSQDETASILRLVQLLLGAAVLRFLQTVITFGALTPAGLFVPSLFIGSCFGRALGDLLKHLGFGSAQGAIEPGIYAMVGAGAMLAGVSRLTLSLAVVLFEITGGLTYVVPFMLAVLIGKWTGDAVTGGRSVSDVSMELKGYTKVEPPEDVRLLNATVKDLFRGSKCAAAADSEQALSLPPVLWTSGGLVSGDSLVEHASRVSPGFAVVSVEANGDCLVLGWADSERLLAAPPPDSAAACADKLKPWQPWQHLQQQLMRAGQPQSPPALEKRAVVQVRSDCPLQTAYCVFENCPHVRALVSVEPASHHCLTVTRDVFFARLRSGCLCPCPAVADGDLAAERGLQLRDGAGCCGH